MNYHGSCLAVYSSQSYDNILNVVKNLKTLDYVDGQLSVIGRRVKVRQKKHEFFDRFTSRKKQKEEKLFWGLLRDLLQEDACFQTSENHFIQIAGELSKSTIQNRQAKNKPEAYTLIKKLLNQVGIPDVSFNYYKSVLKNDQLLLVIHGNYKQLKQAGSLLDLSGNLNVSLHLTN